MRCRQSVIYKFYLYICLFILCSTYSLPLSAQMPPSPNKIQKQENQASKHSSPTHITSNSAGNSTSFYQRHHKAIWLFLSLLLFQTILLIFLVINLIKRIQAEKALAASDQMLRKILDTIPVRVFWKDKDLNYLGANQLMANDAGVNSVTELLGKNDYDLTWSTEQADRYRKLDEEVINSKRAMLNMEEPSSSSNGHSFYFHTSRVPLIDEKGHAFGILGVYNDITEQRQAIEKAECLIQILENTSDLVSTSNANKEITYMNRAGRQLLGWDLTGPLIGKKIEDVHPKWAFDLIANTAIPTAIATGNWCGETAIIDSKGTEIAISQVIMYHKNDEKEEYFLSTIIRDISQTKKIEKALKQSEDNLAKTLNSIGDGVIAIDTNEHIIRMNPVAEKLIGVQYSQLSHSKLSDVINLYNDKTTSLLSNILTNVFNTKELTPFPPETYLSDKDLREKRVTGSSTPIRSADGDVEGAVILLRDITEKCKTQEQLLQKRKMESVGKLAGGVAHDFNNMLVGIMGYANMLKTKLESDARSSYAEKILDTAKKAAELTSKLLAFSRKGKLIFKIVDLHSAIKESVSLLERSIDKRINIKLTLNSADHYVKGDLTQLQNAILNMGVNARDAMPSGGTISILTENVFLDEKYCRISAMNLVAGNYIKVSIKDSGLGIPTENMEQIFEPFFTTKQAGKGTGLGLSVVYGTVIEHKGTITVYSEPDRGTEFHLYIPVTPVKNTSNKTEQETVKHGSGTILVIDDEEIVRSLACDLLEELGYRVMIAADGEQGINTFRSYQHKIDLVILDIIMPKVNGIDCFKEIRKIKNDARIILNSGFIQDSKINDLLKEPHVSFIKKPYTSIQLSTAIQQALATIH